MVTAVELARRVRANPKSFRAWLRREARAGHPLLAGHVHQGRWEFSDADAEQLAREFRGGGPSAVEQPASEPRSTRRRATQGSTGPDSGHRVVETWRGEQVETLADLLKPGLRAVCVGINPSPVSVAAGHYYQGQVGQRFWARLRQVGLLEEPGDGFEDDAAFAAGVGFTDIVKRPSARADDLAADELRAGKSELARKLKRFRPELVIFTFKKTAVVLCGGFPGHGFVHGVDVAGIPAFVMPGPYERADRVAKALDQLARRL